MDFIKKMLMVDEGVKTTVYKDTKNILTVGVGHNLQASPARHIIQRTLKLGDKISMAEVDALFSYDLEMTKNALKTNIKGFAALPQRYQYVLINMTFNLGITGVLQFKNMLKAMKAGNDKGTIAAIKDSKYYTQVPNRAKRMICIISGVIPEVYL
jgi:lysozyme